MRPQHVDTAVIGGGLAGLTAATFIARAGKSVIVLEKGKQLGGRAQTQQRGEFLFNLGPHALYNGAPGSQILKDLNVPFSGGQPEVAGNIQTAMIIAAALIEGFTFYALFICM